MSDWKVTMPAARKKQAALRGEALVIMGIYYPGVGRTETDILIPEASARQLYNDLLKKVKS